MTTKPPRKHPPSVPYENLLYQELQDRAFATAYLNEALQGEEDLSVFLLALRHVMEAQGVKMADLSKQSGLSRESLYKMLSEKGNPEMRSLKAILDTMGLRLTIAG